MGQALKKQDVINLQDILSSDLEIIKTRYPEDLYFEIKKPDHLPFGFCSLGSLKSYVHDNLDSYEDLIIRNVESTHWVHIVEHPSFQRRKLQLISTDDFELNDESEYFILSSGQKHGPYEAIEIRAKLERNEILITDEISIDGGSKWHKIYNLENFDRRALKDSDVLPSLPSDVITNLTTVKRPENSTNNALSLMAFIKGDRKKALDVSVDMSNSYKSNKSDLPLMKILLIASILGISYGAYNLINSLKSPFKAPVSIIGEHAQDDRHDDAPEIDDSFNSNATIKSTQKINQIKKVNDAGRFEVKKLEPIKKIQNLKKSFMESQQFKNIMNENDDFRYDTENDRDRQDIQDFKYDDATPIELDPVMQQVSKEIYDDGLNNSVDQGQNLEKTEDFQYD